MLYHRLTWMTLLVAGILLFSISAVVGAHPRHEWAEPIGAIGWYGFLICAAVLAVIACSAIVFVLSFFLNRRPPSAG
jgi:hypothetical protein